MTHASEHADTGRHPVVYAGRLVDRVAGADLPNDCLVLGEQDALPYKLAKVLNRASMLILLDPFSFPLGVMTGDHWNVPMVVVLPSGFDAESLSTTVGSRLLERLGFFDRFVVPDPGLWKELRQGYCWAESQRVPVVSNDLNEVTAKLRTLLEAESESPAVPDHDRYRRGKLRPKKALPPVEAAAR